MVLIGIDLIGILVLDSGVLGAIFPFVVFKNKFFLREFNFAAFTIINSVNFFAGEFGARIMFANDVFFDVVIKVGSD